MTILEFRCPHGHGPYDERYESLKGIAMAAPYSICQCCGYLFFYIESYWGNEHRWSETVWAPYDRCGECGGKYETRGNDAA